DDRVERRPQLVRDVRQELALQAAGLLDAPLGLEGQLLLVDLDRLGHDLAVAPGQALADRVAPVELAEAQGELAPLRGGAPLELAARRALGAAGAALLDEDHVVAEERAGEAGEVAGQAVAHRAVGRGPAPPA